jgi:TatD DNase family protein
VRFVDSHLHLDSPDATHVVAFAASVGAVLLACGVDRETSRGVIELGSLRPGTLRTFVGVHPSEAEKSKDLGWLLKASENAAGVGEIGLDPTYSASGAGSPQLKAFELQLGLAERLGKPVQVHSRGAEKEVMEILGSYGLKSVLMHWLESEVEFPAAQERGYYVSFSPALLYSKKLQRMAARSDPSLTLIESDSPVSYSPLGGAHGPTLVPSVAFRLAELWGRGYADSLGATADNASRYLGEGSKA